MFEQELNKYWKTVVDTIQDGVMIVDTEGNITSVNRAFEIITASFQDRDHRETLYCIKLQCL